VSIDEVEHQRKRDQRGHEEAKEAAIKLLAARPHSQKEIRTKLVEKGFGMELVKDALDRLQELVRAAGFTCGGGGAYLGRRAEQGAA
jgi:SOS response regulatory protein OraA/RecX